MNVINKETKEEIVRMRNKGHTYRSISEALGVSASAAIGIVKEGAKVCGACDCVLPSNAKFCYMCGAKSLTEAEALAEELSKITKYYNVIPENHRDGFVKTINRAAAFIRERG